MAAVPVQAAATAPQLKLGLVVAALQLRAAREATPMLPLLVATHMLAPVLLLLQDMALAVVVLVKPLLLLPDRPQNGGVVLGVVQLIQVLHMPVAVQFMVRAGVAQVEEFPVSLPHRPVPQAVGQALTQVAAEARQVEHLVEVALRELKVLTLILVLVAAGAEQAMTQEQWPVALVVLAVFMAAVAAVVVGLPTESTPALAALAVKALSVFTLSEATL